MTGAKDRSAKDEHENPDGNLSPDQNGSGLSRQNSKISGSQSTDSDWLAVRELNLTNTI
jgi:hypothetical protein